MATSRSQVVRRSELNPTTVTGPEVVVSPVENRLCELRCSLQSLVAAWSLLRGRLGVVTALMPLPGDDKPDAVPDGCELERELLALIQMSDEIRFEIVSTARALRI